MQYTSAIQCFWVRVVGQLRALIYLLTSVYPDLAGKSSVIIDDECDHSTVAPAASLLKDSATVAAMLSEVRRLLANSPYPGFTATSAAPKLINRTKYAQAGITIAPDGYWLIELPPSVTSYVGLQKLFGPTLHPAVQIMPPEDFPGFAPPLEV